MEKVSIKHIGHSYSEWLRALDFYKAELGIIKLRLTELSGKNNIDIGPMIEHFENQLKLQNEIIDTLIHNIHANILGIAEEIQSSGQLYVDADLLKEYMELQKKFDQEEPIINQFRHEFNSFAAKWM